MERGTGEEGIAWLKEETVWIPASWRQQDLVECLRGRKAGGGGRAQIRKVREDQALSVRKGEQKLQTVRAAERNSWTLPLLVGWPPVWNQRRWPTHISLRGKQPAEMVKVVRAGSGAARPGRGLTTRAQKRIWLPARAGPDWVRNVRTPGPGRENNSSTGTGRAVLQLPAASHLPPATSSLSPGAWRSRKLPPRTPLVSSPQRPKEQRLQR